MSTPRIFRHFIKDRSTQIRIGLIVGFVVLTSLILPKSFVPEFNYEVGKRWVYYDLTTEFDFHKQKSPTQLEDEKVAARARVKPVFKEDTATVSAVFQQVNENLTGFFVALTDYKRRLMRNEDTTKSIRENLFEKGYSVDPDPILLNHVDLGDWEEDFLEKVSELMVEIYDRGFVNRERGEIEKDDVVIQVGPTLSYLTEKQNLITPSELESKIWELSPQMEVDEQRLVIRLVVPALEPNIIFSEKLTQERIKVAESRVSPVFGMIRSGETVIRNGQMIGAEQDITLKSYFAERAQRFDESNFLGTWLGQIAVYGIISFIMFLYLRFNRPMLYFRNRKLGLVLLLLFIMVLMMVLVLKLTMVTNQVFEINYIFLAPFCMVPIILSAFFDSRLAFFGNIVIAMLAGCVVQNGFEVFFIQLCAGTISVYSLTKLRNRADFFISLSLILITYVVAYLGYSYYSHGGVDHIEYGNLVLFVLNVILTIITYPLIYLFEKLFGLTSDLTYVELLDTNHPLLKELSIKAPGTFQHSLQVANIAEAVLNKIGGNSLQTKVGALFHDVGKMAHPKFFIENLGEEESPHNKLSYAESAKVIIAHVSDGVRIAQDYKLPTEIINFIRTHHGTSKTEYFYRMWVKEHPDEEVDENMFMYPGPLPYTRETAILMIADSVEAASRAMKDKSAEGLRKLVEGIVESKVSNKQFINANLTFRDLEETKKVIYNQLMSIYHGRIEYPDAVVRK